MNIDAGSLLDIANPTLHSLLLDTLCINYSVIDVDGNYIAYNHANTKNISMGSTNAKEIDPITWQDCVEVMQRKQREVKEELFNNRIFLSIKQPLLKSDEVLGIIVLSIDITEQRQAARAKEEFLANMAHDLRTPFSGILSMTSFVYERETDPLNKECLSHALNASKNLLKLLNEILEFSKIGSHPIQHSIFNILTEVSNIAALFQPDVIVKGLELNISCPSVDICTDKMRISRILLNLLGNAVKFSAKGKIDIVIKVKSNTLFIRIKDTGPGISQEHLNYIFDKFYKIETSYQNSKFKGAGLGLYITKQFVEDLGGSIKVNSKVDQGTTFTCNTVLADYQAAAN
jgi:two-component system aerobic respiration control sensor histidine kinase ArcB